MRSTYLSAFLGAALFVASPLAAQQEWSFEGDRLLVSNLVGEVTVRGHDGSRIVIRAQPGGDDAGLLDYQVKQGGHAEFHVVFPLGESLSYAYPRGGGSTRTSVRSWRDDSSLLEEIYSGLSGRDRIEIGRRGDLEAWVDLEILVPQNVPVRVLLAVGEIGARDLVGGADLDTHSGSVTAENISGDTRIDTGSGGVSARGIRGSLLVDTGSGSVDVADVVGDDILVDTGSGSVEVNGAQGRSLKIDTGSGRVELSGARVETLEIDTGSGSVRAIDVETRDSKIDTGSGSVTFDVVKLDTGNHIIDTGSGGVTVRVPADASVRVTADAGSGGINLDVPNAMLRRMSRDEVELEIGGGAAHLEIDTGSGSIRIESRA